MPRRDQAACISSIARGVQGLFGFEYHVELSTRPEDSIGTRGDAGAAATGVPARARWTRAGRQVRGQSRATARSTGRRSTSTLTDCARAGPGSAARSQLDLQTCRSASSWTYTGPDGAGAPPRDRPAPRGVRLDRAVHRHPDGALRGRVPAVARAGAGAPDPADHRPRRTRPPQSRAGEAGGRGLPHRAPTCATRRSAIKIREAQVQKIPYMLVRGRQGSREWRRSRPQARRGRHRPDGRGTSCSQSSGRRSAPRRGKRGVARSPPQS